ncbi:MAG: DUF1385 domain-containing protein [Clostridiales bacterium]|nr:DUF1385 domain-containing protein [Clostridiales bacterium]
MAKKNTADCPLKKTSIGGQALIEGIMMRGPDTTSMAVRHVSGNILLENWKTGGRGRAKILRAPFIRGVVNMAESLIVGYKCLMRSAELAGLEDEEGNPTEGPQELGPEDLERLQKEAGDGVTVRLIGAFREEPADTDSSDRQEAGVPVNTAVAVEEKTAVRPAKDGAPKKETKTSEKFLMTLLMVLSMVLGIGLAVGLFLFLPALLSSLLGKAAPVMQNQVLKAVFEGVLRIVLFVAYIALVSLMKDIRRVFMYHGAEHKTIFCYEAGEPLTVENIRRQRRFHPRCGTSFLILVLLVGIVVSMFISVSNPVLRTLIKLLTIPIVVGVGYELIKLAGRKDNLLTRIISAPGMWLQHITTKEPDDDMIECAIEAMKVVIPEDPDRDNW